MPNGDDARFRATRWSLVLQTREGGEKGERALEELCAAYWFPLYAWCRRFGLNAADAEDMVQGFFLKAVEKGLFSSADAERGKLRTFLLTALRRHVKDEQGKSTAARRGGGRVISFDSVAAEEWYAVECVDGESPDHMYDRQWALTLLDQAVGRLESDALRRGKSVVFGAIRPFLSGEGGATDCESAARATGMSAGAFKVAVHRYRGRFREALRNEVASTQADDVDAEAELGYLMEVLRAGG
jgi:DNA-directed RNA polymerase specialized sigma24 family protein